MPESQPEPSHILKLNTDDTEESSTISKKPVGLKTWLQLMRFPAVFTAWSDIILGACITQTEIPLLMLFSTIFASSCLYLAGMVLNDVCDFEEDKALNRKRPLTEDKITLNNAMFLGYFLLALGIAATFFIGKTAYIIGFVLSFTIVTYNMGGKRTVVGPLLMGACRGLNILLGMSLCVPADAISGLPYPAVIAALVIGIYIAGVTVYSSSEDEEFPLKKLAIGACIIFLGFGSAINLLMNYAHPSAKLMGLLFVAVIAGSVLRHTLYALSYPRLHLITRAVKLQLLSLIGFEAAILLGMTNNINQALAILLLYFPAIYLTRWIRVT